MEKEVIKRIFNFLEEKGEHIIPLPVKIKLAMPIAKEDLNVKGDLNLINANITELSSHRDGIFATCIFLILLK